MGGGIRGAGNGRVLLGAGADGKPGPLSGSTEAKKAPSSDSWKWDPTDTRGHRTPAGSRAEALPGAQAPRGEACEAGPNLAKWKQTKQTPPGGRRVESPRETQAAS